MEFILDKMETKIEFFEAYDLKTLERKMEEQINMNKALMLDVYSVQHNVTFDPNRNKMLYTALVHYKVK
ncbi:MULTISPECIES: YrzA family protein [Paenibacillus]|uniref:YrzA family protein n=1 Tax=Paenibacillus radicis (ex Xue et al. 2023) TaxID=2972489 RepID=A0ABT1YUC2_9BACL|nr:YrzA family protein [Paenibacillus radicis (ex Xue et al. 2023)]MCR8635670.1 YrzA family protein [Paenibacillus radicis (ex Xue et al. 2023)]